MPRRQHRRARVRAVTTTVVATLALGSTLTALAGGAPAHAGAVASKHADASVRPTAAGSYVTTHPSHGAFALADRGGAI